eukprot:UN28991
MWIKMTSDLSKTLGCLIDGPTELRICSHDIHLKKIGRAYESISINGVKQSNVNDIFKLTSVKWSLLHINLKYAINKVFKLRLFTELLSGQVGLILLYSHPISDLSNTNTCSFFRWRGLNFSFLFDGIIQETRELHGVTRVKGQRRWSDDFEHACVETRKYPPDLQIKAWEKFQKEHPDPDESSCDYEWEYQKDTFYQIDLYTSIVQRGPRDDPEMMLSEIQKKCIKSKEGCIGVTRSCNKPECPWWTILLTKRWWVRTEKPNQMFSSNAETYMLKCKNELVLLQPYDIAIYDSWISPLVNDQFKILWCPIAKSGSTTITSLFHRLAGHKIWKVEDVGVTEEGWMSFHDPDKSGL